jgi:RecQ family ATP-dependent DNA helicase
VSDSAGQMSFTGGPEDAEALRALQGIEDVEAPRRPSRLYEGPREPELLLAHLGYDAFRPGQREAVAAALAGRDSLIVMPTGGGKSLCYQLPGLASADLAIVVSPLIALMADQWKRLADGGHPAVMIASGLGADITRDSLARISSGEARIVYCSPERFGSTSFWNAIGNRKVDLFAVDEAHCVSEWGHDFRPDYLRLPKALERLGHPTVIACTATATEEVAREIHLRLGLRDPLMIRAGFDRPNLSFDTIKLEGKGTKARKLGLLEHGLADPANRPAIVYCGTRKDTDEVAEVLRAAGLEAAAYHAGMAADERASVQLRFMSGECEVIVATNAFGMGVDKADVRSVWHMAIPTSLEAYYQEAGRGGRDGQPAKAVLLAMKADLGRLVRFIEQRDPELTIARERGWRDYRTIKSFIYGDRCRRRSILDHFGDSTAGRPAGRCCDVCDDAGWLPDPETIVVRRTAKPKAPPAELAEADAPLFEQLKAWRLKAAAGKPAYTVAHNKTLAAIAANRPSDEAGLAEISGVGPSFVAKYADEVLQLVAQ